MRVSSTHDVSSPFTPTDCHDVRYCSLESNVLIYCYLYSVAEKIVYVINGREQFLVLR